jgi:hypothetical protein
MKTQVIKKTIAAMFYVGMAVAAIAVAPAYSQETLSGSYQFGPGLTNAVRDDVNLNVPARTNLTLIVLLQRDLTNSRRLPVLGDVPVIVEVLKPDGTVAASQPASATVVSAGVPIPVVPMVGIYSSQQGCPRSWTVRIRTANNLAPPVRVFGSVTFGIVKPGPVNLNLEGDVALNAATDITRTLAGYNLTGGSERALVAGTGTFRIRAKWHTDPLDLNPLHFGNYFRTKVELLKPNGTVAAAETGFSGHAPADRTPKIDFSYTATDADQRMSGAWRIRVSNLAGNARIVGFDVEKGLVDPLAPTLPGFNSTFAASCSTPTGIS